MVREEDEPDLLDLASERIKKVTSINTRAIPTYLTRALAIVEMGIWMEIIS